MLGRIGPASEWRSVTDRPERAPFGIVPTTG